MQTLIGKKFKIKKAKHPILIGTDLLKKINRYLPPNLTAIIIITDKKVEKLFLSPLYTILKKHCKRIQVLALRGGEKEKNLTTVAHLIEKTLNFKFDRNICFLALGGGVVGDIAGFIAAVYMRGVQVVQIPTTLLAMLDSSIGGKTGVNTSHGKNLIGAFWQPYSVLIDTQFLQTLSRKHLINGLVEAIKIFLVLDAGYFQKIEKNLTAILALDKKILTDLICRAAALKLKVVSLDEKESGLRSILNFGHTIGHALELASGYRLLHGWAVGYGILMEAKIAQLLQVLPEKHYVKICDLFLRLGFKLDFFSTLNISKVLNYTRSDKKNQSGKVHYVILKSIGKIMQQKKSNYTYAISDKLVKLAFKQGFKANNFKEKPINL